MKKYYYLILILNYSLCYSQTPHPLDYFPHHQGDIFEYRYYLLADSFQNIITKDSLGMDGKYYLETTRWGKMSVDTITYEVRNNLWGGIEPGHYSNLLFKLDADSGDTWRVVGNEYVTIKAKVTLFFVTYMFGQWLYGKKIDFADSASGLYLNTFYLVEKFGIAREDADPDPVYYLRGAIINGVKYGIVTSISESINASNPFNCILHQNYPNPFNPTTNIKYELLKNAKVELNVYNLLGQKVRTLVNEFQMKGEYTIIFNSDRLSNGVYVYRLKTSEGVLTRKMLLVK